MERVAFSVGVGTLVKEFKGGCIFERIFTLGYMLRCTYKVIIWIYLKKSSPMVYGSLKITKRIKRNLSLKIMSDSRPKFGINLVLSKYGVNLEAFPNLALSW